MHCLFIGGNVHCLRMSPCYFFSQLIYVNVCTDVLVKVIMLNVFGHFGGGGLMMWAGISYGQRTLLVFILNVT